MKSFNIPTFLVSLFGFCLFSGADAPPAYADFTFGIPTNVGAPLNTSANDGTYSFSADGLELFFASDRGRASGDYDLYVVTRASVAEDWSDPVNLGPTINSSYYDSMPCLSPDGLELFFNSERPGGSGGVDLWVILRSTKNDAWGPPVNLGSVVNSSQWEQHPTISSDGLTLIFESSRPGGYGEVDLWVTTRASTHDAWTSPMNLGPPVNTPYAEWWPRLSPDDRSLFFTSPDRPGGFGKADLWMSTRASAKDQWSVPVNLGPAINTPAEEGAPSFSLDGSILYFASDRPGGLGGWDQWQAPIIWRSDFTFGQPVNLKTVIPVIDPVHESPDCFSCDGLEIYMVSDRPGGYGDYDLWVVRRTSKDTDWDPPQDLGPGVNTPSPYDDSSSSISADGLTLYFHSNRLGGQGGQDIYMTTRATRNDPWGPPVNLGTKVNSNAGDSCPWISADGLELYFHSSRPGGYGLLDIWVTRRATRSEPWAQAVNLERVVNSAYQDVAACVSPDGLLLLFSGGPDFGPFRPGGYGSADMWITRRMSLSDPWQSPLNLGPKVNGSGADVGPRISPDGTTLYFLTFEPATWAMENWQAAILPVVDFNGDEIVDLKDFSKLAQYWGQDEPSVDIGPMSWGDGRVGIHDVAVLVEHWLTGF